MKGFLPAVVARAIAALPDTVTGGVFLTLWIAPFAFGQRGVRNGMLVMLVEFVLVHATIMLPVLFAVMLAGRDTRLTRVLAMVAPIGFYLLFIAALSHAFEAWWPYLAFGWLLVGKFGLSFAARASSQEADVNEFAVWGVSVLAFLGGAFATTLLPLPALGLSGIDRAALGLPASASGIWIDEPYRVMAFGALYFFLLAFAKWKLCKSGPSVQQRLREIRRAGPPA